MNSYFNLILVHGAIVIFASSAFGGTINFDGVNDQVIVGSQADLKMSSQMTLEAWINPARPVSAADTRDVILGREGEYLLKRRLNSDFVAVGISGLAECASETALIAAEPIHNPAKGLLEESAATVPPVAAGAAAAAVGFSTETGTRSKVPAPSRSSIID